MHSFHLPVFWTRSAVIHCYSLPLNASLHDGRGSPSEADLRVGGGRSSLNTSLLLSREPSHYRNKWTGPSSLLARRKPRPFWNPSRCLVALGCWVPAEEKSLSSLTFLPWREQKYSTDLCEMCKTHVHMFHFNVRRSFLHRATLNPTQLLGNIHWNWFKVRWYLFIPFFFSLFSFFFTVIVMVLKVSQYSDGRPFLNRQEITFSYLSFLEVARTVWPLHLNGIRCARVHLSNCIFLLVKHSFFYSDLHSLASLLGTLQTSTWGFFHPHSLQVYWSDWPTCHKG